MGQKNRLWGVKDKKSTMNYMIWKKTPEFPPFLAVASASTIVGDRISMDAILNITY